VTIEDCHFTNKNKHDGRGVAVYYSSLKENQHLQLTINRCSLESAESVVYINGLDRDGFLEFKKILGLIVMKGYSFEFLKLMHIFQNIFFENNVTIDGAGMFCIKSKIANC